MKEIKKSGNKWFLCIFFFMFLVPIFVNGGAGLYYDKVNLAIKEGEVVCTNYYLYNPFDTDSNLKLTVTENLEDYLVSITPNQILVPAKTMQDSLVPIEFCFKVPDDLYRRDSDCTGEQVTYKGGILARQVAEATGSGSSASVGVNGPLTLNVVCVPRELPKINVPFPLIAVILLLLIIAMLFLKAKEERQGKVVRKKAKR